MRSGVAGRASNVNSWDGVSQVGLESPIGPLLVVGDWGEIAPDYDQTLDMAVAKYGSSIGLLADGGANNYRGFPHLTGARIATSTFVLGTTVNTPDDGFGTGDGGWGGAGNDSSAPGEDVLAVEFLAGAD